MIDEAGDATVASLARKYAALSAALARLSREREAAQAALVEALGERRGTFPTPCGAVRVLERPTCRFPPSRVVAALDEAKLLREVASVSPTRLRAAMEANFAVKRAVAPFVENATYTWVDAGHAPMLRASALAPRARR